MAISLEAQRMTACYNKSESVLELESRIQYKTDDELAAAALFCGYPDALLYFAAACCVLYILIGIPGNLITIIALARYKKVRNAAAIFIINLHISDFIFCAMILPMTAMTFAQKHWTFGVIMCRVYPFFKYTLNATSIFTVLAISINRYVIVCHPLLYPRLYKRRNISIMILMLWASSYIIFLPSALGVWGRFDLERNGGFCTMLEDQHHSAPKNFFLCLAFIGPYTTIMLCYARIWWVVRKTAKKSQSQHVRPTHLSLSHTQSSTTLNEKRFISFEPSASGNSILDEEKSTSVTTTPDEEKTLEKYFKAPFRLTRKEVRPKAPTRRDKKLRPMIAAIMISYCISHLPIMLTRLIYKEYMLEPVANVLSHLFENSGNCINPVIYVLMSKEYRLAYKSLFEAISKKFQRH